MGSHVFDQRTLCRTGRNLIDDRPRQRRNKPTLNCTECVERKTRCDKRRPQCSSCVRRRLVCDYEPGNGHPRQNGDRRLSMSADWGTNSEFAKAEYPDGPSINYLRRTSVGGHSFKVDRRTPTSNVEGRDSDTPKESLPRAMTFTSPQPKYVSPNFQGILMQEPTKTRRQHLTSKERPALFNVFGIGSRHVFQNYWTSTGGLAEVISVLPSKDRADLLVESYFEAIDPLYPIISRPNFHLEYEKFWKLSVEEKQQYDAAQLSLHFIIYAIGAQLMEFLRPDAREHTAEFYLSASHQSLCIFSYLNCFSLSSIQTMVLICYFLVSNNHVSDAWTFSGITHRQAYGLELNRDPDVVRPELSYQEKEQRARLWQAIMFQDTSLSLYLGLPPSTLHYDIPISYVNCTDSLQESELANGPGVNDPSLAYTPLESNLNDSVCLQAMWEYAAFVQTHICIPKSLGRSISTSTAHKTQLVSQFRNLYSSWHSPFNSTDPGRFGMLDQRLVRQLIAISSNYFYVLTILYMDKNYDLGVSCDVYGALDAAHEAMSAFFAHVRLCPGQVDIWGTYHTRAFAQAMMIGTVLAAQEQTPESADRDARLKLAKSNFDRYLDILMRAQGTAEYEAIQRHRVADLQRLREQIAVV